MFWKRRRAANPRAATPAASELAARRAEKEAEKAAIFRQARARKIAYQAPRLPPPGAVQYLGDEEAERWCAAWMMHLGATDAQVTRYVADGGIDILSSRYVAQVKNYVGSVGVKDVRELKGIAAVERRIPLFFTSGQYTRQAITFATSAGVALFRYNARKGEMKPVCDRAKTLATSRL